MRLVAGASGVLGSGFCAALDLRGERYVRMDLPWGDATGVADRAVRYWRDAEQEHPGAPVTLVWAAGTGTVAAPAEAMSAETQTLSVLVDALSQEVAPNPDHLFLFSSSAGAIFGGHGQGWIDEATSPSPITAYGREKLWQEEIVSRLSQANVMRTISCRFTNIYGLTSGRLRRKGLVAALLESALTREPARIFVNPDTRRDYLYALDAAALALAVADAHGMADPASTIVRTGTTLTVLDLVATIARVLRRKVPVVFTESPERAVQPLALSFLPRSGIQATVPTTTFEAAIRRMAESPRG